MNLEAMLHKFEKGNFYDVMQNRECIVFKRTRDTEQRIREPCAGLQVPCSSHLQPIVGWINSQHKRIAVAFASWNFFVTVIHNISKYF